MRIPEAIAEFVRYIEAFGESSNQWAPPRVPGDEGAMTRRSRRLSLTYGNKHTLHGQPDKSVERYLLPMLRILIDICRMPLVIRELQEHAQNKRTYYLRGLVWVVFLIVFLIVYVDLTSSYGSLTQMLGRGNQVTQALFITLILTIYALNPIMACAALTTEKEKQTLGLLLISKLTPGQIIIQKICSHMLPLLSLLLISMPMFGIGYLFGGVSFVETMVGLWVLFVAVVQITTVAVFCSALLQTGVAAFWSTYCIMLVIYFAMPILGEMGVIEINLVNAPDGEFILFPIYQLVYTMNMWGSATDVIPFTLLSCMITLVFAVAARFALIAFGFGSAHSLGSIIKSVWKEATGPLIQPEDQSDSTGETMATGTAPVSHGTFAVHSRLITDYRLRERPLAWRELRKTIVRSWILQFSVIAGLFFLVISLMSAYHRDEEEISALFSLGGLLVAVLMMISMSCKLIAAERERDTLDPLLVTPISNKDLLRQKLSGVNRMVFVLMALFFSLGVLNIFFTDVRAPDGESYSRGSRVYPMEWRWMVESFRFMVCVGVNTFIYLHLVKWISIFWGLKFNTQIKAMTVSILSILVLCLAPMAICAMLMISVDSDPNDFPLFFFTSPGFLPVFNEIHEIQEVYRRSWFPDSDWLVMFLTWIIYGSLTLGIRTMVITMLPTLLNRPEHGYLSAPTESLRDRLRPTEIAGSHSET